MEVHLLNLSLLPFRFLSVGSARNGVASTCKRTQRTHGKTWHMSQAHTEPSVVVDAHFRGATRTDGSRRATLLPRSLSSCQWRKQAEIYFGSFSPMSRTRITGYGQHGRYLTSRKQHIIDVSGTPVHWRGLWSSLVLAVRRPRGRPKHRFHLSLCTSCRLP
ncbi:hypothetical protein HD554DRAFT_2069648 [Boletus coccyginus]|nr:hypothetical protein HD554DRAFT_2069648 [Boletus coccyginus]